MRTFTVHAAGTDAALASGGEQVCFVKEGMAWWAYTSPLTWFLYHRMWWEAAAYLGFTLVLTLGGEAVGLGENLILAVNLLILTLVGMEANDLRRLALSKKGYRPIALVHGRNEADAELRFFAGWKGLLPSGLAAEEDAATSAVFDRRREEVGASSIAPQPVWPKQNPGTARQLSAAQAAPDVLGLFPKPHDHR